MNQSPKVGIAGHEDGYARRWGVCQKAKVSNRATLDATSAHVFLLARATKYDDFVGACKGKCTCRFAWLPYLERQGWAEHGYPESDTSGSWAAMAKKTQFETIEPVGARVLVLKDEPKRQTKGGIALPEVAEIPTITGRIVTISRQVEHDEDMPLRQYDKIIFHPKNAIPVDFEPDNQLYVVPVEDVVAVFRTKPAGDEP